MRGAAPLPHLGLRATRGVPLPVTGRIRRIKTVLALLLVGVFALTPWLRWDRGPGLPGQAVIFDIGGRRLFVFDLELWPQELPLVVLALVGAAAALFCATALNGRVWCGFACPQTVWTDAFFAIERWLGRRAAALRHPIFLSIGLATGIAFAGWFTDIVALPGALLTGEAEAAADGAVFLVAGLTWLLGGVVREKVCLAMCPWPRFQAALLDNDSRVVTYHAARGEPRGRARIPLSATPGDGGRGDCIDCGRCVAVCPTLVDIRDGLQMGCIGCGLCIDACDAVMDSQDRPRGLIRFDRDPPSATTTVPPLRWKRAKPLLFGGVALACGALLLAGVVTRPGLVAALETARGQGFVRLSDGSIRNDFLLSAAHRIPGLGGLSAEMEGTPGAVLRVSDGDLNFAPDRRIEQRLLLTFPPDAAPRGRQPVTLVLRDAAGGAELARIPSFAMGPAR